jgi:hypothetical protein
MLLWERENIEKRRVWVRKFKLIKIIFDFMFCLFFSGAVIVYRTNVCVHRSVSVQGQPKTKSV